MNRPSAGFTIVEVVIALTILSMIMLALITAMRTLADTQERVQEVTDRTAEMRMVSRFLRSNIGQAVAVSRMQKRSLESSYFKGLDKELVWAVPLSAGPTIGGLNIARLSILKGQLVIQFQPFKSPSDEPDWTEIESHVLVSDLKSITLAYRADIDQEWEEGWEWRVNNPGSVRVSIETERKFWPELVISLANGVVVK